MKGPASNRGRVFLICGLPGSGKSTYTVDLERRGWARLSVDNQRTAAPALAAAWLRAFNGEDDDLMAIAERHEGVVIEWGFHPDNLPALAAMVQRGFEAWYFDGDRQAAYEGWQDANRHLAPQVWLSQVERLDNAALEIRAVFDTRYVTTIGPGRTYMPIGEIDRILGLATMQR